MHGRIQIERDDGEETPVAEMPETTPGTETPARPEPARRDYRHPCLADLYGIGQRCRRKCCCLEPYLVELWRNDPLPEPMDDLARRSSTELAATTRWTWLAIQLVKHWHRRVGSCNSVQRLVDSELFRRMTRMRWRMEETPHRYLKK